MPAPTNSGTATGRLASAPRHFVSENGSKHVLFTVMVDRPFRNRETGQRDSDAIPLEAWVQPETAGLGVYDMLGKGDLVSVGYTVRSSSYADKSTGEVLYRTALVVDSLTMLESRTVTQQRRIQHLQSELQGAREQAGMSPQTEDAG